MTDPVNSINNSFIKHFESEVINAYSQMGSKLKATVRSKSGVQGTSTTFQVIGKGTAQTKTRNGQVPTMLLTHTPKECSLTDYYAGEWVDSLDELKVGHDERRAIAQAGAYALGRKTDDQIITALDTTTSSVGEGSVNLTKDLILSAFTLLNAEDVPDDGERYAVVSPQAWNQLLAIEEFSSADYIGDKTPYLAGCESRKWLGINFIMHTGLPATGSGATAAHTCYIYHKNAIGHAVGMDIKTDITWHGDYAAHFVNNMMSQGACLIDANGAIKMSILDTPSVAVDENV